MAAEATDENSAQQARELVSLGSGGLGESTEPMDSKKRKAKKVAAPPPLRLKKDELLDRMCLASSGLVEEIHTLALRQNTNEDQRETRLDAKAQGLMGTAGLSLTVAFTFGGLVLQNPKYIEPLGRGAGYVVLALYAFALLFGLLASIWSVRALFVRDGYKAVTDNDVFNKAMLESIDQETHADANGDRAKRLYRRFITVQHWTVYRHHFDVHETKAKLIKRGQWFFITFLVSLIVIGGALAFSAFVGFDKSLDEQDQKAQQVRKAQAQPAPLAPAQQTQPAQPTQATQEPVKP